VASVTGEKPSDRQDLEAKATALGVKFNANISDIKLQERVAAAEQAAGAQAAAEEAKAAETATAADDDKKTNDPDEVLDL
jgi:hypothetical protein